ncbi:MAG: DUF4019 domain-containing protein [Acidobacteriota bacterium]
MSTFTWGAFALACVIALGPGGAAYGKQKLEDAGEASANAWLTLIDQGKYGDSWEQAAQLFKGAVTKDDWKRTLAGVRTPLGKMISRKVKSRHYTESLPGAPDGKYVVIQYETTFEHKKSAIETVTPMVDPDGRWRVSGYFIK